MAILIRSPFFATAHKQRRDHLVNTTEWTYELEKLGNLLMMESEHAITVQFSIYFNLFDVNRSQDSNLGSGQKHCGLNRNSSVRVQKHLI